MIKLLFMNNNDIILSLDMLTDYYGVSDNPHISNEFLFFENGPPPQETYSNKYIINNGLLISLLRKGKISIYINFKKYTIKAPAIVSIFPDYIYGPHKGLNKAKISSLYISINCIFDSYFLPDISFLSQMMLNPVIDITDSEMAYLNELKYYLRELYKLKSPLHGLIMRSLFYDFLIQVTNNYPSQSPVIKRENHQKEITTKFFTLIRETDPPERGVPYYADQLCVSPKYLSVAIKNITGYPAIKWINRAIIFHAKKMLKLTDLSILDISEILKFQSSNFFIYFFKEKTGFTPLQYRKEENFL